MNNEKLHAFRENIYCGDCGSIFQEMWTDGQIKQEIDRLRKLVDEGQITLFIKSDYEVDVYM